MGVAKILLKSWQFSLGRITKLGANGIHSLEGANGTRKKIGGYYWTRFFERCGFSPGTPVSTNRRSA